MESDKIALLLDKYFEGETNISEENELRNYFSSRDVAEHLEHYKPLFGYFSQTAASNHAPEIPLYLKKSRLSWLTIAASAVIFLGIGTFTYVNYNSTNLNQDLGTYDDPEVALAATQKALALLSNNVNVGIGSVQYIKEYEDSKQLIFKQ